MLCWWRQFCGRFVVTPTTRAIIITRPALPSALSSPSSPSSWLPQQLLHRHRHSCTSAAVVVRSASISLPIFIMRRSRTTSGSTSHAIHSMDPPNPSTSWQPPSHCRGMINLERERFRKTIKIPMLSLGEVSVSSAMPHLKPMLFKMEHLKPMQTLPSGERKMLLHPITVKSWYDLPDEVRNLGITGAHLTWEDLVIGYDNWKAEEVLRAVLPEKQEALTSFSRIGHILHVNLRDHLLPYKRLIGEVLRDKVPNCRAVVNKSQTIDNTFRNFQLELLCGEPDYRVEVKENGVIFEFDFANVYWNPRLATEHERVIRLLRPGDVFYDIFAGVGPFSIPIGKRKCTVLANDLNPESYRWLQHNAKRNKVLQTVQTFNRDGREFIRQNVRDDLLQRWQQEPDKDAETAPAAHIAMNLPAMALEFLDAFRGLVTLEEWRSAKTRIVPMVHAYCFAKGDRPAEVARADAERCLGARFGANLDGIHFVRNVAPNKDMFRVSFMLTEELMTTSKEGAATAATVVTAVKTAAAATATVTTPSGGKRLSEIKKSDDGSRIEQAIGEPACKKAL